MWVLITNSKIWETIIRRWATNIMVHPDNENSANLQKNVFGVGSLYGDGNYLKHILLSKRRDTFKVHLVHECP